MLYSDNIKKIIRSSGIYTGVSVFNQAISFLMLPVLTRFLSPLHYGILATFQAVYPMSESFVDMGSTAAVSRKYFDKECSGFAMGQYIFNALVLRAALLLVLFGVFFSFKGILIEKFHFPLWLIALIPCLAFIGALTNTVLKLWIAQKMALLYSFFQCGRVVINIGLSLFLVAAMGLSWGGRVGAITFTEFSFAFIGLAFLLRNNLLKFGFSKGVIKDIWLFGMPVFVYGIGQWIINLTDRFFLNVMVGVSATGIYSVGYSLASVVEFIAGGVSFAVMAILFEKLNSPSEAQKLTIVKYTYLYFIGLFIIMVAWILILPYFVNFFVGKNFSASLEYVPWISAAYFANAMCRIFFLFIVYSKKTIYLVYAVSAAAIVNLALNYILIRANGAIGAAQSTLISFMVKLFLTCIFMQKVYPMPWFRVLGRARK